MTQKGDGTSRSAGTPDFDIFTADASDAAVFYGIELECFDEPWTLSDFEGELSFDHTLAFKACEGDCCVGFIIASLFECELYIGDLAVRPAYRRAGIAGRLMRTLFDRAGKIEAAYLEVEDGNDAAIGLYEKFGFRKAGFSRNYYEHHRPDGTKYTVGAWRMVYENTRD
ncbi:MAG: GNAT family N-acetyltransferase [Clostridia bacterium]|nr:GNAT family N-acetyltransferase [Clostridia bacterium]